ncbi:MAG: hypothetical protein KKB29_03900 [Nanoarchaeota archaeon]|nr:hypothetical protein [Nanoarchaeota archaeon]
MVAGLPKRGFLIVLACERTARLLGNSRMGFFVVLRGGEMKKVRDALASLLLVMLLACAFMMLSATIPARAVAAKCGEPGTCVVLVRTINVETFCRKPNQGGLSGYGLTDISGYDYSCEYLQATHVGGVNNCFYPISMYSVVYYKWSWERSTGWRLFSSTGSYYTVGDSGHMPLPPVPGEIVSHNYVNIQKLYPNGCSDLPFQQPDQIPNFDIGKPECNDQVL